jgi:hypothetical protein
MESHAEIKDRCNGLETRLDEIAADIRDIPFNYRVVHIYSNIDEEIYEIYEWYESMKTLINRYIQEKVAIENRLKDLDLESKSLNNLVQNLKSRAFSRDQLEDSSSR